MKSLLLILSDKLGAPPVVLINQALAQPNWHNENPIGRRIAAPFTMPALSTVVGIVGDLHHKGIVIADSVAPKKLSVVLLAVFAAVALLLAAIGIYGVMSFLVVQRTHETGVRMALGTQRSDVLRLVISHAGMLSGAGTVLSLIAALLSTSALRSALYGTSASDLATFSLVTVTLALVAFIASYLPARRATKADPMIALGRG